MIWLPGIGRACLETPTLVKEEAAPPESERTPAPPEEKPTPEAKPAAKVWQGKAGQADVLEKLYNNKRRLVRPRFHRTDVRGRPRACGQKSLAWIGRDPMDPKILPCVLCH